MDGGDVRGAAAGMIQIYVLQLLLQRILLNRPRLYDVKMKDYHVAGPGPVLGFLDGRAKAEGSAPPHRGGDLVPSNFCYYFQRQ